ncbi:MAG: hypothetical protein GY778_22960 [bacterium]|nr:hypothetical protein [bacterium]
MTREELEAIKTQYAVINGITFPIWSLTALLTFYPVIALIRGPGRRWRRRRRGLCLPCGYDLTGNVSGVCPECGEAISCGVGSSPCSSWQPRARVRCTRSAIELGTCNFIWTAPAPPISHTFGG